MKCLLKLFVFVVLGLALIVGAGVALVDPMVQAAVTEGQERTLGQLDRAIAMGNQTTISSALEWLALLKADAGEPAVLAMVDGFTEKFRVTPGVGRVDHEAAVARAVDELGDALFDAMRQRGGASQLEDVVALLR